MRIEKFFQNADSLTVVLSDGNALTITAWREDVIRLTFRKAGTEPAPSRTGIIAAKSENPRVRVEEDVKFLRYCTDGGYVELKKYPFEVRFIKNGKELCRLAKCGLQLRPTDITEPHWETVPGTETGMKLAKTDVTPGYRFWLSFDFGDDERILGLGQYNNGRLNRREVPIWMYQTNDHAPVPFFTSTRGYGVLVDTGAYSSFTRDTFGTTFYTDSVPAGDFYFTLTDCAQDAVRAYRYLTGAVPMMPKWLFGYTQSKERYATQKELLDVLAEYRRRRVPLDLIVQDWQYWSPDTWSDKSFDPTRYPDPQGMCDEVHNQHAHIMISVWPNTRGGDNFRELFEKNAFLCPHGSETDFASGGVYNPFTELGRDTCWRQLSDGIFKYGFDAWWCDCSEPFEDFYGSYLQLEDQMVQLVGKYKRFFPSDRINLFSLFHSSNIYEHQRAETNEKRVVNLTRSGYAGQQRYSTIVWSGDIEGSFAQMRKQIAEGLSFSASGLPYWTFDIGGFWAAEGDARFNVGSDYHSVKDPGYRELYTRWLQIGCFMPVMRSHGTIFPREIWQFGEEGEPFYDAIRHMIELRYRMIPYIYSTAYAVSAYGESFLYPLAALYPHDEKACRVDDAFFFGKALYVSPVTEPQYYEGADVPLDVPREKAVYLPEGDDFYEFDTGIRYEGGQTITVPTPLDRIPVFVRAGSILPLSPVMQYVDEIPDAHYEIRVYPGADADFMLYEDAGDGYAYENGEFAVVPMHWNDSERTLVIGARQGTFPTLVVEREYRIALPDGEQATVLYKGEAVGVRF
jgi:alpha-D-xyloside xylohydrolase